ncbi:hypothetical protein MAR_020429 [Mya arenaria]|uniref:Ig-like domain-containing protein n=1 Tax=Mya arenaria TaxID=6604 RepID=A0ABY7E4W2_MYAAR|nr:hypothetical protein MAR_020429 [Mya arenaria]
MTVVMVKVIFGVILVMYSEAVTLNLTYTPNPALENSAVTLTCSYTGLQSNETIIRVTWDVKVPNETIYTKGRIIPITAVSMTAPTDSTVTINAGDSETFKCRTSGGLPQATIKWFKVTGNTCSQYGMELKSSVSNSSVIVVKGLRQVDSTMLFNATSTDNGLRICCTASNVAEMQHAPSGPPVIIGYASGSNYSMIENRTEILTCSSTGGNPLATLTWDCFNGQMFSPTVQGSMVKRVVQWTARRNENARCTCTASHVTGQNQSQSAFVNVKILCKYILCYNVPESIVTASPTIDGSITNTVIAMR